MQETASMSDDKAALQKLIKQAQGGDENAVSEIYQEFVDRIYSYIAYRVGSTADAEDLTGAVFLNMIEGLPRYKITGAPFEAWLYRIASARVADYYRKKERLPTTVLPDKLVSPSPLPEEQLLEQQEITDLHTALEHLSEDEQQVLILRFIERKSHKTVASILNKNESAVKNIQHRALTRLAAILGCKKKSRHYLRGNDD
jgi:RNA polymerase sigma-70 factor, ECF subfamily